MDIFSMDAYTQYGYIGIAVALILEFLALPIPGQELLIFCGFLTTRGDFDLTALLAAAMSGSMAGFFLAFALGRRFGRPLLERYGKYIHLSGKHLDRADELFEKYRWPLLLFGRYITGVRHAVPYLSGLSELSLTRFAWANAAGSILWVIPLVYGGRVLGDRWDLVLKWVDRFGWWALLAVIPLAAIAYLAFYLRRRRRDRA